jgi:hypothetical protein
MTNEGGYTKDRGDRNTRSTYILGVENSIVVMRHIFKVTLFSLDKKQPFTITGCSVALEFIYI